MKKYFILTLLTALFATCNQTQKQNTEKPNVIISTGSNITIPIFILGKLLGCKTIYIECSAQVRTPSLSGKICYLFADLFIVQWKYLLNRYGNKAVYGGLLI